MKWESRFTLGLNPAKNSDYIKKYFKQKLCKIKFSKKKKVNRCIFLSTPEMELEGSDDLHFWNITMHWMKKVHFGVERCKKYELCWKMLQAKVAQNLQKTQRTHIVYHSQEWSWGALKICCFWNIIMHWMKKVHLRAEHCKNTN